MSWRPYREPLWSALGHKLNDQRLLVITSSYPRGIEDAAGHFVASEVEELRREGHEVIVWAAGSGTDSADPSIRFLGGSMLFEHPGAWPRLQAAPYRAFGLLQATCGALSKRRREEARSVDRVIAHWLFPAAVPWALLATPGNTPIELVIHGSDLQLALRLPNWLLLKLLKWVVDRKGTLRFVSQAQKHALRSLSLTAELRALVDSAVVRPSPIEVSQVPDRAESRVHLGISPDSLLAVIVGRLIPEKRIDTALHAAALVPGLQTAVIGTGPLKEELRARFPAVGFLGQLDRNGTLRWIQAADLLLSGSRLEGAPTAIREAIELKTPVVAVESGDLSEWSKVVEDLYLITTNR